MPAPASTSPVNPATIGTRRPGFIRPMLLAALLIPLTGCGLGDAGSSAATAAKLKAHEAEQAQATKARIETQLDAANQQAEQRRKEAEAANR